MLADDIIITGSRAVANSYAKINLTLDVLDRREDGYHDLRSVMQTISIPVVFLKQSVFTVVHLSKFKLFELVFLYRNFTKDFIFSSVIKY